MSKTEKIQKIGVTAFIYNKGKILLVRRAKNEKFLPGYFEMPGGKVEFTESPHDALRREIKEEVNLDIEIVKPYSLFSYVTHEGNRHTIDIQFLSFIKGGANELKLSSSHSEYVWIKRQRLIDSK